LKTGEYMTTENAITLYNTIEALMNQFRAEAAQRESKGLTPLIKIGSEQQKTNSAKIMEASAETMRNKNQQTNNRNTKGLER
jgi:hypothetical protein